MLNNFSARALLLWSRYYLEIISVPIFGFLVVDLFVHGFSEIFHWQGLKVVLIGIVCLIIFTYVWHLPSFKKWIPCTHDHCQKGQAYSHILATILFCLHFFADSSIRHQIVSDEHAHNVVSIVGVIGFLAHFLVDIILAIVISTYWHKQKFIVLSLCSIAGVWFIAFFIPIYAHVHFSHTIEALLYIFSSFILAMFIHKPHKPYAINLNKPSH